MPHFIIIKSGRWLLLENYKYKGNKELGDARINWEYNRHHYFPILVKNYWITKDKDYINTLSTAFTRGLRRTLFDGDKLYK